MRTTLLATILSALACSGLHGQPVGAPAFEVASVKAVRTSGTVPICIVPCGSERVTVSGARVDIRSISLQQLVVMAYRVKLRQVAGPAWMNAQKFDILAKIPEGASVEQLPEMLRTLLVERFGLSAHRESKERPVYALAMRKTGPQPRVGLPNADEPFTPLPGGRTMHTPYGEAHMDKSGVWRISEGPYGPARVTTGETGTTEVEFLRITMPALAEALTGSVDRVVTDATALPGNYRIKVDWIVPPPPRTSAAGDFPVPAPPPSFSFQSLERAGVRLEATRSQVEMIVVDSLEKTPTGNQE